MPKTATGGGKPSSPDQASKFIGTLQYMAPEVIIARGDDFDASDSSQVASHPGMGGKNGKCKDGI